MSSINRDLQLIPREHGLVAACFAAMASPCEVLLETDDMQLARRIGQTAAKEAWRIEEKFSRYRADSIVTRINTAAGAPVTVDAETAALIDYAAKCYALSERRFDITSGVLRRLWNFKVADRIPDAAAITALLPLIGFDKLNWQSPVLTLPIGMEIDLGGIGKEYAVDRTFQLLRAKVGGAVLVNFGGDLRASAAPAAGPWRIGVERPDQQHEAQFALMLQGGGLATSGNTHRYLMIDGVRYGHILDPRTGWPIRDAPLSVTVAAADCTTAGMFCTFAMLQGANAEQFLDNEGLQYWCLR